MRHVFSALCILIPLCITGCLNSQTLQYDHPVASTRYGFVMGAKDNGILVFKGIPYGSNTRYRRFQPPLPPAPWKDTLDATQYGAICPQAIPEKAGLFFPDERQKMKTSEDCLNLNIWTPALHDSVKRPVMVYFHGGGFTSGSGNNDLYNGTRLCKRGNVVVVTVNHRINLFGYLYLAGYDKDKYRSSGNVGMLDLILSLTWIKENIAGFGGDANNITIFGESGGGAKCATLMAMPLAHGLFHKVITESGQQVMARTIEKASETTASILKSLGIDKSDLSALDSIPTDKLVQATGRNAFAPIKDFASLPRDPFDRDAPAISQDVPMMLGITHDEMRYLIGITDTSLFHLTWDNLLEKLEKNSPLMGDLNRSDIIAQYKKLYPEYDASDVFFAATTASRGWRGLVIESEHRASQHGAATYVFQLRWKTPVDGGKWKAPHTLDIPLVFDNIAFGAQMTGTSDEAQKIADMMSESWLRFARTGNPDNPLIPHWEPFTLEKKATMIFDTKPVVEYDPLGKEINLFLKIPYIQPGTR